MKPKTLILRTLLAITVGALLTSVTLLHAQVDTGTIVGRITDASGAVVGGARVTLTNEGTGASLTTTTGPDGTYTFTPVRIGTYKLDATAPGFQTVTQTNLVVQVRANVVADFTLKPGNVTQTVEVTAAPPVLQTQDASVGQVMDTRNVNNLPLNGRNWTFLAQLAPGVNAPQADTRGNAASGAFAANGLRPAQNNYMLDGIDNNSDTVDFLNGTNFVILPPVDAIQEFKVQTTGFSAEFGRSGAAVLNATIKSGTNNFHGSIWEFLRNDKMDAADFFERVQDPATGQFNTRKGKLRLNQYGFSVGGPVLIPHVFDGRNKLFFFGDFEGLKRRLGVPHTATVPTAAERSSGYTDFTDLLTGQSGSKTDILGRTMPLGTILDPATTRTVGCGVNDPISGRPGPPCAVGPLAGTAVGFARDPFGSCPASTASFTPACNLNHILASRLDANAIKLLNLYPLPNNSALFSNFATSPVLKEDRRGFDTRMDANLSASNQTFFRFSLQDDPQFIPSVFGGVADGGGFQEGNQTALAEQGALAWTHTFTPSMINVARGGLNYLHTTRVSPAANDLSDIPGKQFGILGIPQVHENGGLPAFAFTGLQTLGSNAFLPSDEVSSTIQITDDFTKIYGKHTFKAGYEYQRVKFSTLQPPYSRGQFNYNGNYTDIPSVGGGNTGRAQFLLTPIPTTVAGGIDFVGGPNQIQASNIFESDNGKNYHGTYINDDWRVTPKLTLNLGLRWDYFGQVFDHHNAQANFVPGGPPTGGPMYIIPPSQYADFLANFQVNPTNCPAGSTFFPCLLAKDGIALAITDKYGRGLGRSQKTNFAPRFGFAYQVSNKLVARGGFGMFYNGFENRGYSPNIGENYPFQFSFNFQTPNDGRPIGDFAGCATATGAGSPTLETGFSCTPLDPLRVKATGLNLRGIQFQYTTPYSMSGNFTLQYQLTNSMSAQAAYVTSLGRHLESFPGSNQMPQIVSPDLNAQNFVPFPDFARGSSYAATIGSSYYHGLQTKLEKQFSRGLNLLATYTWSKVRSDALDLLNGFSAGGYRAPGVPGIGIHADYGLANFDVRNVVHLSGAYELPFGKGKSFMSGAEGISNTLLGGWSINWASTLQGGQPIEIGCPSGTAAGLGCRAFVVPGVDPTPERHLVNGFPVFLNAAAFRQPCKVGSANSPNGCVPLSGLDALGGPQPTQVPGPGFHRLDLSLFKDFRLSERYRLQFRSEFFNILNHPNFNAPGFGGNGVVAIPGSTNFTPNANGTFGSGTFGMSGSTRDAPYDPRQIQLALKMYF